MMTRRAFATTSLLAPATSAAGPSGREFQAVRTVGRYSHTVPFSAAKVFPLLCPVREYDWIDGWRCEVLFAESGKAENNCIFVTNFADSGRQVWNVSRYEPNRRIEFVMIGASLASRLNIELNESAGETTLQWERIFTGLTPEGNRLAALHDQEWTRTLGDRLHNMMLYYLMTGRMLATANGVGAGPGSR
jgi:hypothetical protein